MATPPAPIPLRAPIVDKATGAINIFFRQLWEQVRTAVQLVATLGQSDLPATQTAAIVGKQIVVTTTGALYRVTYYFRKTVADGVSSSLKFRWHWTENGIPLSKDGTALTTDTTGAVASESFLFFCDQAVGITYDIDYASNTPAKMTFESWVRVEQLG